MGILLIGVDEIYTSVFSCMGSIGKDSLDFPLMRTFFSSFSFSVIRILVENSSKIQCGEKNLVSISLKKKETLGMMFGMPQLSSSTHNIFRS